MPDSPTSWLSPKAVVQVGAVSCIAIYLVFIGAQNIPATKALAVDILREVGVVKEEHKQFRDTLIPLLQESNCIQCAQCRNDAETVEEINRCGCDLKLCNRLP